MVVAATLLNGKFCADAVTSAENHISCTWVAGPVPRVLLKAVGGVIGDGLLVRSFISKKYRS